MSHLRHTSDKTCNVKASPNTYEVPFCQETDCPSERIFCFFPASGS
jgi:hypothetical protein